LVLLSRRHQGAIAGRRDEVGLYFFEGFELSICTLGSADGRKEMFFGMLDCPDLVDFVSLTGSGIQ